MTGLLFSRRALLCFLLLVFLGSLGAGGAVAQVERPRPPIPGTARASGGRQTSIGMLMKGHWRRNTRITEAFPPSRRIPDVTPASLFVTAPKDHYLIVLNFAAPRDCIELDRRRLIVKDGEDKSYQYGGWQVDGDQYRHCAARTNSIVNGPWGNIFWDPVIMQPGAGFLDLVYEVPAEATKLVFTDGVHVIELDPILGPRPKPDKKKSEDKQQKN